MFISMTQGIHSHWILIPINQIQFTKKHLIFERISQKVLEVWFLEETLQTKIQNFDEYYVQLKSFILEVKLFLWNYQEKNWNYWSKK